MLLLRDGGDVAGLHRAAICSLELKTLHLDLASLGSSPSVFAWRYVQLHVHQRYEALWVVDIFEDPQPDFLPRTKSFRSNASHGAMR